MTNYFNSLNFREKLIELGKCTFMHMNEFINGITYLKNKNIVIIGCGSQGLNQGLNLRDSGLNISYALREQSILNKNVSWQQAKKNNFKVDSYINLIPHADLVINLTPDKQHSEVIKNIQPLMKKGSILGYSHGFNIVEIGQKIRQDITVIMVAPKCPGTEVREEYKRNFGVPTLIAVHTDNDPDKIGLQVAKAWAVGLGSHRAGVLHSSFIAEVKSDLMGEQTILCGLLQSASIVCYEHLIDQGFRSSYAGQLIQNGWEILTTSLKYGGITLMLDRLSNTAKIRVCSLSTSLKKIFLPIFRKHMDDIISGNFSAEMIKDWNKNDKNLLYWRNQTKNTSFEKYVNIQEKINEKEHFDHGIFMIAILKSGIELAFEVMVESGIKAESAYYESLHELPLIANTITRKRLYEMNQVISDTAEYGNYLFTQSAIPLLKNYIKQLHPSDLGKKISYKQISNIDLEHINQKIYQHPIEIIGRKLRSYMNGMTTYSINNSI
ncbi:ketol-acid reductoisomerase [Buchnera aphidicola]|uniref:ketol-acid reductoisomerase n=1 Tax=Buchnera aphidicola TaxID=9 RepID=UPI0031B83674